MLTIKTTRWVNIHMAYDMGVNFDIIELKNYGQQIEAKIFEL